MKTFKFAVEIKKEYSDGASETKTMKFNYKKDLYGYVIIDCIATTLESAREELTQNEFTNLCLNVCGFMAEYFT